MPNDETLIVPIAVAVLVCNVACALWLLVTHRPARHSERLTRLRFAPALRACCAEAIGTFALVLMVLLTSCGAAMSSAQPPALLAVALAAGLTVAVMMAAVGSASGGHFNPAITLGFVASGRLHPLLGAGYALAQLIAAVAAAGLVLLLFGSGALRAGLPAPAEQVPLHAAVVVEAAAAFFVVLVFFGTSDLRGPKAITPLAVGATVAAGALALGRLTGAALNPARYLGPALLLADPSGWAAYLVGPCVGGCTAAVLMQLFFCPEESADRLEGFTAHELPSRRMRRSA
jgi:aquaporin TIP